MALADILKLITTKAKKRSAADLRVTLAEIDPKALEAEVDRLEAERRRLLVHGSDAEVLAIGNEITAANLACERGGAAIEELNRLIAEAERREANEAIAETEAAATKLHADVDANQVEIDKAADRLASLLNSHRTKLHNLGVLYKTISIARGEPAVRLPEAAVIRRNVVNRIGLK